MNHGIASTISLWLIRFYQRWLSPRKGYRCAYAVHHGGPGCSGFAKNAISENGLWEAIPLVRERFRLCASAASNASSSERPERRDEREARRCKNQLCGEAACNLPALACCSNV
ncbi:MAG: membrane protein insertion efficiency factor YidD [Pseudomonadota bacterium]